MNFSTVRLQTIDSKLQVHCLKLLTYPDQAGKEKNRNSILHVSFYPLSIILLLTLLLVFIRPQLRGYPKQDTINIDLAKSQPNKIDNRTAGTTLLNSEDILFKSMDGQLINIKDLQGKVVFINFWATWCPPCMVEMPTVQSLYSTLKKDDRFVFLLVDVDDKPTKAQKFMNRRSFDLPVYTPVSPVPHILFSGALPTTVVLNKNRKIVFKHEGAADYSHADFIQYMNKLADQ